MAKPLGRVVTDAPRAVVDSGPSHVLSVGLQYLRGRLPEELWTGLCRDPMAAADGVIELFDGGSIDVSYDGTHPLPRQLDAYRRRITGAEGAVYVFEDASIFGRRPVVEADGRYFSASWFGVDTPYYDQRFKRVQRNLPLIENIRQTRFGKDPEAHVECGFLLDTERGAGFHHWFYEVLPKLYWYEKLREATGETPTLISHSPLKGFQRRSLELMGYDPESVLQHPQRHTAVETLFLAPHPIRLKSNQYQCLPVQLDWVGERITAGLDLADHSFSDRVYVSRADADRRFVVNEEELVDRLADYGFESYEPGRYSFEDQIRLFANAETIVGPHGLAYTNLIYADDATLVELFPRGGGTATYFVAATELGLTYECLECPAIEPDVHIRARDKDLAAPVEDVVSLVEKHQRPTPT